MPKHIEGGFAAISKTYQKPIPALWLSKNAPVQSLISSQWTWDLAVEYNGALYAIGEPVAGAPAIIWKYTAGTWTKLSTTGLDATSDEAYMFFIDSRGYLFISFLAQNKLYRSIDDGVTFTVIATATQTSGGEYRSMCEDDQGSLYIAYYDGGSPADGTEVFLGKSEDGGATFADISGNLNNVVIAAPNGMSHMHSINFDPYRKILFATCGDRGPTEPIQYSTDYGATFTEWASSPGQTICMTFDSKYIYFSTEITARVGDENSIWRAASVNDTPAIVQIEPSASGFAWHGHTDNYGHVFFAYSSASADQARFHVSQDNGDTWYDVYPPEQAVADKAKFARVGRASYYADGENGFFYNSGYQYRIYPGEHVFNIDETNGVDPYVNSTSTFNTIPDGGGINNHMRIKLVDDYATAYTPGEPGLIINKNGNTFTDTVSGTELFTMDLETEAHVDGSTPLAGAGNDKMSSYQVTAAGDVDASSTQAHNGTLSMKCATGGGNAYGRKDLVYGSIDVGDVAWWQSWIYFDKATAPAGNVGLGQITNSCNFHVRSTGFISVQLQQAGSVGRFDQGVGGVAMPLQTWFKLKVAVKRSTQGSGDGYVKVWQAGRLVIEAIGIDTNSAGTAYARAYFGSAEGNQTEVLYLDEMVCAAFDPDKPTSPVLNGTGQVIIPDGIQS